MTSAKNKFIKLLILLLLLSGNAVASAQQDTVLVEYLTGIYHDIKAGKLVLLGDQEVHIKSKKAGSSVIADVYAVSGKCFDDIYKALSTPENWCEFAPLHLNVKSCTCTQGVQPQITFYAGRKFYRPPEEAYELKYRFQVTESEADRFRVKLSAEDGPHGTSDYMIVVEAVLIGDQTLVHMGLSYTTSLVSRLATSTYLSTIGSGKVGFSIDEHQTDHPAYVTGEKGIIERNVMRYFLALTVYLDTLHLDPAEGFNSRAAAWYDLTEQYAMQLHELDKQEYLEAKKREHQNQQELQRRIDSESLPIVQGESGPGEERGSK